MLKKIASIIKWGAIFYCTIFTVATLINSVGALWLGIGTNPDVHGHIILRAGVCFIITIIVSVIKNIILRGNLTTYIIVCSIALFLVMAFIWALTSGYLWVSADEVHPDGFRDMTRSIAVPFAIVAIIIGIIRLIQSKKKKNTD